MGNLGVKGPWVYAQVITILYAQLWQRLTLAFPAKVSFPKFAMTGKFVSKGLYIDIINFKSFYLLLEIALTSLLIYQ